MSIHNQAPGTAGPPATVKYAAYAQFAVGVIGLLSAIVGFLSTSASMDAMREAMSAEQPEGVSPGDVDTIFSFAQGIGYAFIVVGLLFAAVVALLGVQNLKGKNGARITTWVLGGLGLLCSVCGALGGTANLATGNQGGNPQMNRVMEDAMADIPGWYGLVNLVFVVLNVLLYLAIIILLAMPASNAFFSKPKTGPDVTLPPQAYQDGTGNPPHHGGNPPPPGTQPPGTPPNGPDDPKTWQ